jgi:hypothetical protein
MYVNLVLGVLSERLMGFLASESLAFSLKLQKLMIERLLVFSQFMFPFEQIIRPLCHELERLLILVGFLSTQLIY